MPVTKIKLKDDTDLLLEKLGISNKANKSTKY